jgi:hypothetical protein
MRCGDDVRTCSMHPRVDRERGTIDGSVALDDLTLVIDEEQVAHLDL